jgi:hypothetical protein
MGTRLAARRTRRIPWPKTQRQLVAIDSETNQFFPSPNSSMFNLAWLSALSASKKSRPWGIPKVVVLVVAVIKKLPKITQSTKQEPKEMFAQVMEIMAKCQARMTLTDLTAPSRQSMGKLVWRVQY